MMQRYRLDFYKNKQTNSILGYGLLLVGLITLLFWYLNHDQYNQQLISINQAIAKQNIVELNHENKTENASRTESEQETKALKSSIETSLLIPWNQLLLALENSNQADIKLLEVLPDATLGVVRIVGQTQSLKKAFNYVEALKEQANLVKVNLVEHQSVTTENQPAIQFAIEAVWNKHK